MLYFFHHYELPLILRQVQLQNMLIRSANSAAAGAAGAERNGASATEAEADGETQMESETIDRDSDSLRPEAPSDTEMEPSESVVLGSRPTTETAAEESLSGGSVDHPADDPPNTLLE